MSSKNNFPVKPIYDKIIVDLLPDYKPKGGIIIPDAFTKIVAEGEVVAVGEGYRREDGTISPMLIKVGDKVKFRSGAGTPFDYSLTGKKEDAKAYHIVRESDVLCIFPADYKCNEVPFDPKNN